MSEAAALFERERPRLTRIAYRMLGTMSEAEDVVQAAWLRFAGATGIDVPEAWLTRTVSRLALDALRAARRRRETYVGPWLPEPLVDDDGPDEDTLDAALMLALERLTPLERAAFLLHDVFGMAFEEVARALGREAAACRQLAARARRHVRAGRPRFGVAPAEHEALARAFHAASRSGDVNALAAVLAEEVVFMADGGGVRLAALRPIAGRDEVVSFFRGLVVRHGALDVPAAFVTIDGLPGLLTREADGLLQTAAFVVGDDGLIAAILVQRNPGKLARLEARSAAQGQGTGSP